jgi:hypothetical protein
MRGDEELMDKSPLKWHEFCFLHRCEYAVCFNLSDLGHWFRQEQEAEQHFGDSKLIFVFVMKVIFF